MGHRLLIRTLALLAAGLLFRGLPAAAQEPGSPPTGGRDSAAAGPHAELSCAACHRGPTADRELGAVPAATCTASGCHASGGPEEVRLPTVTFRHRSHGDTAAVEMACAGCHRHETGDMPLRAGADACAFCHADELTGARPEECRTCHSDPDFVPVTNQGVELPHRAIPWIETGCVRCHFDVGRPSVAARTAKCVECHDRPDRLVEEGIGRDLHPEHTGVGCVACHEGGGHDIRAMSTSVRLQCESCHGGAHGVETVGGLAPELCTSCHRDTHAAPQRLVLGRVPGMEMMPSYKFRTGLTCRSCHGPPPGETGAAARTPATVADACAGCHVSDYRRILSWWGEGARIRDRRVRAYLDRAVRSLGSGPDTVGTLLGNARALLELAREGGAWHNPELVDRMQRQALTDAADAWRAAGRSPPARPELGSPARVGFCSYCHYQPGEPVLQEVPETGFHARRRARER